MAQIDHDAGLIRSGQAHLSNDFALELSGPQLTATGLQLETGVVVVTQKQLAFEIAAEAIQEGARKRANVAAAVLEAAAVLDNDSGLVPAAEVGQDWLFRWRDAAAEVSTDDLQKMWGQILAGEVKSPGQFSLRTLEFVRNLSQSEANLIAMLAPFVLGAYVVRIPNNRLAELGLAFGLILELADLGLVSGVEALGLTSTFGSREPDRYMSALKSHDKVVVVEHDDADKKAVIPVYQLSAIGREVMKLAGFKSDLNYLREAALLFVDRGFRVAIANRIPAQPGVISWEDAVPVTREPNVSQGAD